MHIYSEVRSCNIEDKMRESQVSFFDHGRGRQINVWVTADEIRGKEAQKRWGRQEKSGFKVVRIDKIALDTTSEIEPLYSLL